MAESTLQLSGNKARMQKNEMKRWFELFFGGGGISKCGIALFWNSVIFMIWVSVPFLSFLQRAVFWGQGLGLETLWSHVIRWWPGLPILFLRWGRKNKAHSPARFVEQIQWSSGPCQCKISAYFFVLLIPKDYFLLDDCLKKKKKEQGCLWTLTCFVWCLT